MGTVRQNKKRKNPSSKVKLSRKALKRKGRNPLKNVPLAAMPPSIRENWDKNLTLLQNYERMGIVSNLNGKAGGIAISKKQKKTKDSAQIEYVSMEDFQNMASVSSNTQPAAKEEFEEIEPIEIDINTQRIGTKLGTLSSSFESISTLITNRGKVPALQKNVLEAFEKIHEENAEIRKQFPRLTRKKLSQHEARMMQALVNKHGDNIAAMARDMVLNPYQLTPGQLKRNIESLE